MDQTDIVPIRFGTRLIGPDHPTFIIAEIGINHEGDVAACMSMVKAAADCGVDAVKLQSVNADESYVQGTESHKIFSTAALTQEETRKVFDYAASLGVEAFTTVGDLATLEWVKALNPPGYKISSGLLSAGPILRAVAGLGRPLLMSTGMTESQEVDAAIALARASGARDIGLFQCTSIYPAPAETLDLRVIAEYQRKYRLPVGYSDHCLGTEACAYATAAGANMLEKHFTLDVSRPGFDHRISLDATGMAEMVRHVRLAETMLGRPHKRLHDAERRTREFGRRCLVVRCDIAAGEVLTADNLAVKRPLPDNRGLDPAFYDIVIGKPVRHPLRRDQVLHEGDVDGLN